MTRRENRDPNPRRERADVQQVSVCERAWRTFADGKAKDGGNTGAPIGDAARFVRRLQVRIAKAVLENRWNKVKRLQYLLTTSLAAKLLAVRRVTSNRGKNTPGVDGVLWQSTRAKQQAVLSLRRRGYQPRPLRRIYIPKKNGKLRPLSIPTMHDRAMQALYKLALAPVAETIGDRNSYGFREGRGCADAIAAAFNALSKPNSATWVLEGDIKGCFDNISHEWLMANVCLDKEVLGKWLKCGYVEGGIAHPTKNGTPQGGIISPTLANLTLDGLEAVVHEAVPRRNRINFVRYADDFLVTGKSRKLLDEQVKPAIAAFLNQRGLTLSEEKTVTTHITDGFTFLGQSFRKHGRKLHITPSRKGLDSLIDKVGMTIHRYTSSPMPALIAEVNSLIRGWANYHRHVVASDAFRLLDNYVAEQLWRMLRRRHPQKAHGWLQRQYWSAAGKPSIFAVRIVNQKGHPKVYQVQHACDIGIRRYIKVKADANPYLPEHARYFWTRRHKKESKLFDALSAREHAAKLKRSETAGVPRKSTLSDARAV